MPVHSCDLVEGTMLGQGEFRGAGSAGSFSKGLLSSSVEVSALPGEAVEPIPAEVLSSPSGCSRTEQQDTCKNVWDAEPLQCLIGRIKDLTGCIRSICPSRPDPLFPVFIVPSCCVIFSLGRKLP